MFSTAERTTLVTIAREAIRHHLEGTTCGIDECAFTDALRQPFGVFVTLDLDGQLRGCIGSIIPISPLFRAVAENAIAAATRDPRFFPLTPDEFPRIQIELSVLGHIETVRDLGSIIVGRDGLLIRKGRLAGLLLPQVATEYGWDRDTFLSHTCLKAGLAADSWRSGGCTVEKFEAEVFGEIK